MVQVPGICSASRLEATWSVAAAARLGALLLGAAALLFPASAWAQLGIDDEGPDRGFCEEKVEVVTVLKTTGAYVPGATIGIRYSGRPTQD